MKISAIQLPTPAAGGRVLLRRLRASDLSDFQAYRSDAEVARYQGWSSSSDAKALKFLNEMADAPGLTPGVWWQLGIAESATDRLIGDVGLCVAQSGAEVEIGFSLSRAAQGRGFAAEALKSVIAQLFEAPAITSIIAVADARNASANRLLRKLGFELTSTDEALFKGELCIENTFSLSSRPATAGHPD